MGEREHSYYVMESFLRFFAIFSIPHRNIFHRGKGDIPTTRRRYSDEQ
jgi:hypothetical protein